MCAANGWHIVRLGAGTTESRVVSIHWTAQRLSCYTRMPPAMTILWILFHPTLCLRIACASILLHPKTSTHERQLVYAVKWLSSLRAFFYTWACQTSNMVRHWYHMIGMRRLGTWLGVILYLHSCYCTSTCKLMMYLCLWWVCVAYLDNVSSTIMILIMAIGFDTEPRCFE